MKVAITKFVHVSVQSDYNYETHVYEDKHSYAFYDADCSEHSGYGICLGPQSFEVDLPERFAYVDALAVEQLKADRDKLTKAFHAKVEEINQRLNRYLAIEG